MFVRFFDLLCDVHHMIQDPIMIMNSTICVGAHGKGREVMREGYGRRLVGRPGGREEKV